MKTKTMIIFLLVLFLSCSIFLVKGWTDTDSYAFYNRSCLDGKNFNTPTLSMSFFSNLDCTINNWKVSQMVIMIILLLSLLYLFKINNWPIEFILVPFTSSALVQFWLNFEDDQLAWPIIVCVIGLYVLSRKKYHYSLSKKMVGSISLLLLGIALSLTIWQGSIVLLLPFVLWFIFPISSILAPAIYFLSTSIGSTWGNSAEAIIGRGFFTSNIPLYIFLIGLIPMIKKKDYDSILLVLPYLVLGANNQLYVGIGFFSIIIFTSIKFDYHLPKSWVTDRR